MSELRLLLCVSRYRVLKMIGDGMPVWHRPRTRHDDWLFNLGDCLRWSLRRDDVKSDVARERTRLIREQADKAALKNARLRGQLVDVELVSQAVDRTVSDANVLLCGLPSKLAPLLVDISDPAEVRNILERGVEEVQAELRHLEPDELTGQADAVA